MLCFGSCGDEGTFLDGFAIWLVTVLFGISIHEKFITVDVLALCFRVPLSLSWCTKNSCYVGQLAVHINCEKHLWYTRTMSDRGGSESVWSRSGSRNAEALTQLAPHQQHPNLCLSCYCSDQPQTVPRAGLALILPRFKGQLSVFVIRLKCALLRSCLKNEPKKRQDLTKQLKIIHLFFPLNPWIRAFLLVVRWRSHY